MRRLADSWDVREFSMGQLNLLEKTELWVDGVTLDGANLTDMAAAVARELSLPDSKVMVVDVRDGYITFDLLEKEILQENIMGKEQRILRALEEIPGVRLSPEAQIHSDGILGLICAEEGQTEQVLQTVDGIRQEISQRIAKRAIVFPTGFELEQGLIEDTNTPYLRGLLEENGYQVTIGDVIPDSEFIMTDMLSDALSRGFGVILTTGGVGAEDKDHSVESVLNLDPDAAAPYIVKYKRGHGRHVKDGVRIAVGKVGPSTLITLPGPHDEVEMTGPLLVRMLLEGCEKGAVAEALAEVLRQKWK